MASIAPLFQSMSSAATASDDASDDRSAAWSAQLVRAAPFVLALFAGVVWLAYAEGVDVAKNGGPRLIAAPAGPERVPPDVAPSALALRPSVVPPLPLRKPQDAPAVAALAAADAPLRTASATPGVLSGPVLQIGSYPSEAFALASWPLLKRRYPEVLGALQPDVRRADLQRGTFYRLRAGPFPDATAALAACDRLKTLGGDCRLP
jgi:hypothetical protein